MLIRIFRSGYIVKIFMFLIISLLLWLPAFLSPPAIITSSAYGLLYDKLVATISISGYLVVIIAFVLLMLQAIIFNAVLVENPLFSKSVFLPALIYVILMSNNPAHLTLHPMLVSNFFLVFALKNLYNSYGKNDAFRESFNASFWVAVASLFYLPALYMMLLIWSTFLIFRISSWREWIISLIAAGTPFLILIIVHYLIDQLANLMAYYPEDFSWLQTQHKIYRNDYFFWPPFLILLAMAYYRFSLERSDKIISIRKGFAVVNVYLIISVVSVFFSGPYPHQHAYLMFPAAAVIIAFYFIESKKMLVAELLFLALLISITLLKFL